MQVNYEVNIHIDSIYRNKLMLGYTHTLIQECYKILRSTSITVYPQLLLRVNLFQWYRLSNYEFITERNLKCRIVYMYKVVVHLCSCHYHQYTELLVEVKEALWIMYKRQKYIIIHNLIFLKGHCYIHMILMCV